SMKLSSFDAFPKASASYKERRRFGGIVSILITIVLCLLVKHEISEYIGQRQRYDFFVDKHINHPLQINVDITFAMRCEQFTADGATLLSDKLTDELHNDVEAQKQYEYGMSAFSMDRQGNTMNHAVFGDGKKNGCRLSGSFDAAKIAGNLHVTALGHGHGGGHVPHEAINFTHRIDRFSFGKEYPSLSNPLDNSVEIDALMLLCGLARFSSLVLTNQYAVTEYHRGVNAEQQIWPGVYFKYTIEPISVRVTEGDNRSLFNFLTRLCGVIGGIWVTTGLIYAIINSFSGTTTASTITTPIPRAPMKMH
ncbi:endoplasmic reticulum vesicle transporter-domain-containing protein, partial [Syncephalis pseudoplumigaleata]